ncbi:MAG: response regulator transcription factor [Gemmatimonadales bacterium]|nr:response regulator transcription factor [Gemmatimonadales bacterium]MDZ4390229.1 response regulator transcription factor [Gemmatimonadales bacterium]
MRRTTAPVTLAKAGPDSPPLISLVIIDDNRLLLEGLAAMIRTQPEFRVLVASTNVDEALAEMQDAAPDIVLLDIGLEGHDSLSLTAMVHQEVPAARVIVMGLLSGQDDVADYVRVGAAGFVMKESSAVDLFSTIRSVASGTAVLPPVLAHTLFTQIHEDPTLRSESRRLEAMGLTVRERQVVDLLGTGLSNKEIATHMNIAVHTVKSHVHNVLEKLTLRSRLEVAAFTHRRGPAPDAPELDA